MQEITPGAMRAIRFSGYLEKTGAWPVGGGVLDQSASFLAAHEFYRHQIVCWEAEMKREEARKAKR